MTQIYRLACGLINSDDKTGNARPIVTKSIPFNRFFSVKILRERNMFVHIGVEKVPIIKGGIIKRYEYTQYMQFLDILGDAFVENKAKTDERMHHFVQMIHNDMAKKDHSSEL